MRINKSLITYIPTSGSGSGSVTSVALTAPTGFVVSGSPITSSGTLAITFAAGYSLPTTTKQGQWDSAYAFTSTFPSGTAGQLLRVNTLGTALEFFTPSFLTSASINATTPLVWNSGTNTMSIPAANNTTNGYLTSTDWLTFSSKQPAITLTTTGNNGSATLIGATLNIPTYTLAGLGGMSNPMTSLGDMIYGNAVGIPLRVPPNTSTTKKYLSMTGDGSVGAQPVWDTIPASIGGSGTTNRIPRFTASNTIGDSIMAENSGTIDIYGTGRVYTEQAGLGQSNFYVSNKDTTAAITHETRIVTQQLGSGYARTLIHAASFLNNTSRGELGVLTEDGAQYVANIGTIFTNGDNAFSLMSTSSVENIRLNTGGVSWLNGGNVGIGTNNPSYKLDIRNDVTASTNLEPISLGLYNNNDGGAAIYFRNAASGQSKLSFGVQSTGSGTDDTYIAFSTGENAAISERVRIAPNGNVGINNNNPSYTLDVSGTIRAALNTTYQTENGPLMAVSATTPNKRISVGYDNTNDFGFISCLHSGVGWKKLVIQGNGGNVAIGHTAAAEQLDVLGNIKLSGYVTGGSWQGNAVYPAYGGTGATSLTGVVIGNGTSSMTAVAGTSMQLLRRNFANDNYEFFTPDYISSPMTGLGDMIYGNAVGIPLRVPANTSTTKKFLSMTGDGTVGAQPVWEQITAATIGGITGSGTSNVIPKFTSSNSVGDSIISESSTLINIGANGSASEYGLQIGNNRSGNGYAYIDLVGDATYTDYGFRIIRDNGGANTNSIINHRGTGPLQICAVDAGSIQLKTNNITRSEITSTGQLRLNGYTSTTSYTGVAQGILAFDANGYIITQSNIPQSGNYSPTLYGISNVNGTISYNCQYMRIGNVVSVSGRLEVDASTASSLTIVEVELPYNTTFANAHQCNGVLTAEDNICGIVLGSSTRAALRFTPPNTGYFNYFFTLHYEII